MIKNAHELLMFYKNTLTEDFMRFWDKAFDHENGGYYTCFSNDGANRISTDKYIWSQGRMLWIDSRYAELMQKGIIPGDPLERLAKAEKTYRFINNNAILPEGQGVCAYLCEGNGTKKESIPGKGFYTSFYVDCFVIMGYAEYSRVSGKIEPLEDALKLYDRMRQYIDNGYIVSEPYPIPEGFDAHSVAMIMVNVTGVLYEALNVASHARREELALEAKRYVGLVMTNFFDEDKRRIIELVPKSDEYNDTLLAKHVNPGHAVECMWFCLKVLADTGWNEEYAKKAFDVVYNSIMAGWDKKYGGLLRITNGYGEKPEGRMLNTPYDTLLADTWDSKLWWPHSEALYVTLLCSKLSDETDKFRDLYDMVSEYVFRVFPNPNREIGEWIQILDRDNSPMNKVVALPVKDPYHIMRNIILIVELIDADIKERAATK